MARVSPTLVGNDDSDIAVLQLGYDILNILNCDRIDTRERLVKKNEFRIDGKRTGYLTSAALTAGQLDTLALADLGKG